MLTLRYITKLSLLDLHWAVKNRSFKKNISHPFHVHRSSGVGGGGGGEGEKKKGEKRPHWCYSLERIQQSQRNTIFKGCNQWIIYIYIRKTNDLDLF